MLFSLVTRGEIGTMSKEGKRRRIGDRRRTRGEEGEKKGRRRGEEGEKKGRRRGEEGEKKGRRRIGYVKKKVGRGEEKEIASGEQEEEGRRGEEE